MRSRPKRVMRNAMLSLVNALPFARRRFQMNLSGLSRRENARVEVVDGLVGSRREAEAAR
jgi:hypothetical protein